MTAPEQIYLQDAGDFERAFEVTWCTEPQDDADTKYIRADLALVAVKVKPLEWKWHRDPKDTAEARTQIGSWTVWEINGSAYCHGPNDTCGKPCEGGIEGAMAFAQADYEARILAALDFAAAPDAAKVAALVEAIHKLNAALAAMETPNG